MVQLYACVNVEIHSGLGFSVFVLILVFPYSYRIVSYRTRVCHLPHSFSARTRVRHYPYSYRIISYSGTSPTSFVLCTYSSTSLSVLVSYRIVLVFPYSYRIVSYHTRVCHLPRSFSARTRVRHYPYSYRIVSYSYFRTRIISYRIVLGYVTYLVRSLHVLEYVIIHTRIVSYRTRVRHLPRSFSARTRVRHYPYSYRIVSYSYFRARNVSYRIVLGYVTYLIRSLHVLEYVIIRTRIIVSYSGTSPTSFVLCTYSSTALSILDLGARQMGTAFAAFSLPTTVPFFFFFFFLMVTFSPELFTSATVTLLVPVLIVA